MVRSGAVLTYLTNAHGDVTALVDAAGAVVARWTYDAWGSPTEYDAAGNQVAVGTAGNPFLFAGYFFDAVTGLYYLRARYYDPGTGRFLSMDPEPGALTDRLSQNPYIYCQNDPVNLADPDGRAAVAGGGGSNLTLWQKAQIAALRAKKAAEAAWKKAAAKLAAEKKARADRLAAQKKARADKLAAAKKKISDGLAKLKQRASDVRTAVSRTIASIGATASRMWNAARPRVTSTVDQRIAEVTTSGVGPNGYWKVTGAETLSTTGTTRDGNPYLQYGTWADPGQGKTGLQAVSTTPTIDAGSCGNIRGSITARWEEGVAAESRQGTVRYEFASNNNLSYLQVGLGADGSFSVRSGTGLVSDTYTHPDGISVHGTSRTYTELKVNYRDMMDDYLEFQVALLPTAVALAMGVNYMRQPAPVPAYID